MEKTTHIYVIDNSTESPINKKNKAKIDLILDGKTLSTSHDIYTLLRNYLHFPKYVENNLDALYDTMCDLEWLSDDLQEIYFHIKNYDDLLKDYHDFKLDFIELLHDVADTNLIEENHKRVTIFIENSEQAISDLDELGLDYYY